MDLNSCVKLFFVTSVEFMYLRVTPSMGKVLIKFVRRTNHELMLHSTLTLFLFLLFSHLFLTG